MPAVPSPTRTLSIPCLGALLTVRPDGTVDAVGMRGAHAQAAVAPRALAGCARFAAQRPGSAAHAAGADGSHVSVLVAPELPDAGVDALRGCRAETVVIVVVVSAFGATVRAGMDREHFDRSLLVWAQARAGAPRGVQGC